ncbi:hypothetical protein DPMN_137805 [Dreissena polymorpha]|uniref:Uncharacterized protein n=1 Tax=Dreissena polymorpha TaxID=45954 RepID=A0A9D4JE06_DREPO|nr:hypothetical protein DPMN_137805 [Dreissena polymorpha]
MNDPSFMTSLPFPKSASSLPQLEGRSNSKQHELLHETLSAVFINQTKQNTVTSARDCFNPVCFKTD